MSKRFHVATRKGVFTVERRPNGWSIQNASFLGDNCSMIMHDPRSRNGSVSKSKNQTDGTLYAALGHGHFGVKMHRSVNGGRSWDPIASPVYPPKPEGYQPRVPAEGKVYDWILQLVWALSPGG